MTTECDVLFKVPLPGYIENIKEKLAENLHELWAMSKIENGWIWGDVSELDSINDLRV